PSWPLPCSPEQPVGFWSPPLPWLEESQAPPHSFGDHLSLSTNQLCPSSLLLGSTAVLSALVSFCFSIIMDLQDLRCASSLQSYVLAPAHPQPFIAGTSPWSPGPSILPGLSAHRTLPGPHFSPFHLGSSLNKFHHGLPPLCPSPGHPLLHISPPPYTSWIHWLSVHQALINLLRHLLCHLMLKMAEARFSQDELTCPVCLDLLKDPVTIQCGHSYCKSCITGCWDQEDQMRVYSCPQCRQTFSPRPALGKNTMLAELVEKLKNTKLPADCYAGAGDVQCDVCTGRKYKAVKSCLVCLNSYCQNHLEQHEGWFKGKRHNLTDATGRLQEMICQKHEKLLEVFCRTDQKCICVLCTMDEHKNHDTVSAATQRTEKQKQLKEMQKTFQQRIQQREKDLQQLREAVESHKRSAQTAVEDSERIFTELIRSIERSRSELIRLIRDQEKRAVSPAEEQLKQLEQEINDLRRRDAELEQLSHTQDHIQFLQSFQSLSAPPQSTDENDDPFSSLFSFDDLRESVRQVRDKLEGFCKEELKKISDR
ncbi:hypothetical protein M9458_054053, partial [Cirrhinus mrigala]